MDKLDYLGKVCPFCKTPFTETDDIVVCSACEMPHHKECWVDNRGCTTFGCSGTIDSPDSIQSGRQPQGAAQGVSSAPAASGNGFCTKCGAALRGGDAFCPSCGNPLMQTSAAQTAPAYAAANHPYGQQNLYGTPIEQRPENLEMAQMIGPNSAYYLQRFADMKARSTNVSWNWIAFLVAPFWMVYRKMYAFGAAFLGSMLLFSLFGGWVFSLLSIGAFIVAGLLGNYLYMRFLDAKMQLKGKLKDEYKEEYAVKNSGVDSTALVIAIVSYALLAVIVQIV